METGRTILWLLVLLGAGCHTLGFLTDRLGGRFASARRRSSQPHQDECAVIAEDPHVAKEMGTAYVEVGQFSLVGDVDISMDVLPDTEIHDGILFAIGTEGFRHFELGSQGIDKQFLVIEFSYSALSLTLKAEGHQYLLQFELFKTYPNPYSIEDGRWHHIQVVRNSQERKWIVSLDNTTRTDPVTDRTDINMHNLPAFIGGRPGYRALQFNGVIKNLVVNGQPVVLSGRKSSGQAEVWHCTAPDVLEVINYIQSEPTRDGFSPF